MRVAPARRGRLPPPCRARSPEVRPWIRRIFRTRRTPPAGATHPVTRSTYATGSGRHRKNQNGARIPRSRCHPSNRNAAGSAALRTVGPASRYNRWRAPPRYRQPSRQSQPVRESAPPVHRSAQTPGQAPKTHRHRKLEALRLRPPPALARRAPARASSTYSYRFRPAGYWPAVPPWCSGLIVGILSVMGDA